MESVIIFFQFTDCDYYLFMFDAEEEEATALKSLHGTQISQMEFQLIQDRYPDAEQEDFPDVAPIRVGTFLRIGVIADPIPR